MPIAGRTDLRTPPYFFPAPHLCPEPPAFTPDSFLRCMARRGRGRMFFMGNSFARGMGYALAARLNGLSHATRDEQKQSCAKVRAVVGVGNAASCTLNVTVPGSLSGSVAAGDAAIRVLWRATLNSTGLKHDFCFGQPPAECYRDFFDDSRPGDVLVTTVGMDYALGLRSVGLSGSGVLNWTLADVDAFMDARWFKGTIVWTTIMLGHPAKNWGSYAGMLDAMNDFLVPVMRARGVTVVDMRRFGADLAPDALYVDAIHPHDEVYAAALFHAVATLCDPPP